MEEPDSQGRVVMLTHLCRAALVAAGLAAATGASAATFVFNSDPFAGSAAPATPGRQIVGGEPSIVFDVTADQFVFDRAFFDVGGTVVFANDDVGSLASSGLNVIVLETFDNDGDPGSAFGAGAAANLLANQITADGAGFFVYFNSALNLPRLVYSTNLNEPDSDLKILARMTNLTGNMGGLAGFTAANFAVTPAAIPEPATWAMMLAGFMAAGLALRSRTFISMRRGGLA